MQRTVLLSQFCPSVRPSVRCVYCDKTITTHCEYFDTTRNSNHSSFLTPTVVGGWCALPSEICAQSDPPPVEKRQLRPISAHNVSTVADSGKSSVTTNIKSTTGFPTSYRWSSYVYVTPTLSLSAQKGGSKSELFVFWVTVNGWSSQALSTYFAG